MAIRPVVNFMLSLTVGVSMKTIGDAVRFQRTW